METQAQIPQQIPVPTSPTHHHNFLLISVCGALLLGIGLIGGYFIGNQTIESAPANTNQDAKTIPMPTLEESATWKRMTLPTIGLSFTVPPKISEFGDIQEEIEKGDTGMKLCAYFAKEISLTPTTPTCQTQDNPYMIIGATSIDYSAGRGGMFTDLEGFVYKDGKYLVNFVGKSSIEAFSQERISKIENKNGVQVIMIKRTTNIEEGPTLSNALGNNVGALINSKNPQYPGLAIIFRDGLTEQEIIEVLKSFKFTN